VILAVAFALACLAAEKAAFAPAEMSSRDILDGATRPACQAI
jgi:hypothetical protein